MTERPLKPLPFTQTGSGARAVVFIHGLFDEGGFWRRTVEALETRYLALVTFDLPGMGKVADDPGPFSLERLAQAVTSQKSHPFRMPVTGRILNNRLRRRK